MFNIRSVIDPAKPVILAISIFSILAANSAFAQSSDTAQNYQQPSEPTTRPLPENPSDLNKQPRKIHRIGTAIPAPRNSISIKSTDAGAIRRPPPTSGCTNCGIIDFVNKLGQGPGLNAIAGGVVAGTVAREVIRQTPHSQGIIHPNTMGSISGGYGGNMNHPGQPGNPYQVGITMSDGSQAIIALPDASNLQQGDRIQLIDGVLVLDRQ
ncbi:hypothetical protein C8R34_101103 [Nitrosomonas sp. Nm84]|uniref:hypothetical protein n=1 Tax=Nitrosomonas sp. Nm84 TaxID=200124 RepID=UPI000D76C59D|nr:hypothetical protein [Nitrosomonas sp. Nm84]PXW91194.1 hypothetical protein C8R34_101103 [Nitrosomonas sp. Nm84]